MRIIPALLISSLLLNGCVTTGASQPKLSADQVDEKIDAGDVDMQTLDSIINTYETGTDIYTLPGLKAGFRPAVTSDEAGLWMRMEQAEKTMKTAGGRVLDPELNTYIKKVVCRLAGPFCGDIRVYIIDEPVPNASMAPNGMMLVHTGILLQFRNEAQLSSVLGHEIGHFLRRHSLQRIRDAVQMGDAATIFGMLTGGIGTLVAAIVTHGTLSAYSRDHEREADKFGALLLQKHRYSISNASDVWDQFMRIENAKIDDDKDKDESEEDIEAGKGGSFFSSHPGHKERRDTMHVLAKRIQSGPGPYSDGRREYWAVLKGYRLGFLEAEISRNKPAQTLELLKILTEDPESLGELKYIEGEVYRRRRKDGDMEKALTCYQDALKLEGYPAKLYRAMGTVLTRLDRPAEAREAYQKYLEAAPAAPDHKLIRQMVNIGS